MIRIRRLPAQPRAGRGRSRWPRRRRPRYVVQMFDTETSMVEWTEVTPFPIFIAEKSLGVGDASVVQHEADREWAAGSGRWGTMWTDDRDQDAVSPTSALGPTPAAPQWIRFLVPNAVLFVLDPDVGELPTSLDDGLVTSTSSALAVGTMHLVDGATTVHLGPLAVPPLEQDLTPRWRGTLETSGRLCVVDVDGRVLLETSVPAAVEVVISSDRVDHASVVWVAVA